MRADPCEVCNGTEFKLLDGFYYCIECNTQNTNVRETVVEQSALGDGTFALATRRKIVKLDDSKIQMSGEWYKWHAYNFIILGLADELVAAGAKPTFKTKLLWIWTRYIKKYQNKDELVLTEKQDGNNQNVTLHTFLVEENSTSNLVPDKDEELDNEGKTTKSKNKNVIMDSSRRDIHFISRGLIIAMLYLALNLDESDIQLSHLLRFIKENHVNFKNLQRFVPVEINVKKIQDQWINFVHSKVCNMHHVRTLAMSLLRKLDLGTPKVPDLRKIIDNFLTELCLPNDMKPLIYSLMHFHHCDFLDMSNKTKEHQVRLPDYEGIVMSYVLVALKMCFGLDGEYEERLSDAVEKINDERNLSKSYKFGKYSEPSNRLFSFREWCSYMQFRKMMLSKSCLKMTELHCLDIDDIVYLEQMPQRPQKNRDLQDETAIDLINKIPEETDVRVIPKHLFLPSLTPMSEYTEIIIEHNQDQEMRELLSEDFTQYSLKYACEYLDLKDENAVNIVKGVSENNKTIGNIIRGIIEPKKSKSEMVYVKNCENRNWMKTNPPTMEHVTYDNEHNDSNDKESDLGYDSENPAIENEVGKDPVNEIIDTGESITKVTEITTLSIESAENIEKEVSKDPANEINDTGQSIIKDTEITTLSIESAKNIEKAVDNETENVTNDQNFVKDSEHGGVTEEHSDSNIDNITFEKEVAKDTENVLSDKGTDHIEKPADQTDFVNDTEKNIDDNVEANTKDDKKLRIIIEEGTDKNIFDDLFVELDVKDEVEQNNPEDFDPYNEVQPLQNNDSFHDDRASISDLSDYNTTPFNPDTFDRERTIKELILNACKKHKIPVPSEYRSKDREPRKRKRNEFGKEAGPRKRAKPGESKKKVEELMSSYFNNMQSDFINRMQEEVNLAFRNTQLDSVLNVTTNPINLEASDIPRTSSILTDNMQNQSILNQQNSVLEQSENNKEKEQNPDITEEIDEDLESKLFDEDEVMELDDLVPKGDPKFDEEKYDVNQLYLKIKDENEMDFELEVDPKLEEIISKNVQECKHSENTPKANLAPIENEIKSRYESDSEDEISLKELQEGKRLIEEKIAWEENFDPFINKDNVPEFKYWFRHYDPDFMTRSMDLHKPFDEELKENTPSSFYFVISECANILNSSTFYLYKNMQNLEQYISVKAKIPDL